MRTHALSVALLLACTGCASFVPLAPHHAMANVGPRDTVRIVTTDGRQLEFVVERVVRPDRIQGDGHDLRISTIDRVEVAVSSGGFRTVWDGISLSAKILLAH